MRKLLWECLFWRFKRAKSVYRGSKMQTHSFLFDDDDDTDHSIATTPATHHSALTTHSQNRFNYLSRQNSNSNYPIHLSSKKSSIFTCCGLTIDLSNKHSLYSSNGDLTSRRSTICKSSTNTTTATNNNNNNQNSPGKFRTFSHSPRSSTFDRNLRRQKTVCYPQNNVNHPSISRQRASTIVHCFRNLPPTTVTAVANPSLTLNTDSPTVRRSISKDKERTSIEKLPSNTSNLLSTPKSVYNANMNSTKDIITSTVSIQNHLEEEPLSAYIVETC